MANPGIGGLVQPQPGAVTQGLPPATPQEHAQLTDRWHQFFTNPAVSAALFQFGSSLLANSGSNLPFAARAGVALGDAGRAVGGAAKFQADQQTRNRELQQGDTRLQQGQQQIEQQAGRDAAQQTYQAGTLANEQARMANEQTNSAQDRAIKLRELQSTEGYRNMSIELQREQLQGQLRGTQSPRERMMIAALKNSADAAFTGGNNFDADKYLADQLHIINTLIPPGSEAVIGDPGGPAAPVAPPAAAPTPAPAPAGGGTPTPQSPLPGAIPYDQAVPMLKAAPTPENKAHFDAVYGPGEAEKALKGAPASGKPVPYGR